MIFAPTYSIRAVLYCIIENLLLIDALMGAFGLKIWVLYPRAVTAIETILSKVFFRACPELRCDDSSDSYE